MERKSVSKYIENRIPNFLIIRLLFLTKSNNTLHGNNLDYFMSTVLYQEMDIKLQYVMPCIIYFENVHLICTNLLQFWPSVPTAKTFSCITNET